MKDLTAPQKTMSSLEIAKLTEKDHDKVLVDIRKMLDELEIGHAVFSGSYKSKQNKDLPCFNLPHRECDILVSGYSIKYRAAIVDRWQELEAKSAIDPMQLLSDPAAMRGLLLTYTEKVLTLEATVKEIQPKADALDRIATESEGALNITSSAKTLQLQPKKLIGWLQANKWIYKRAGGKSWVAYQDKIQSGVLEHKITTVLRGDGTEKMAEQVLVTAKGLTKLSSAVQTLN